MVAPRKPIGALPGTFDFSGQYNTALSPDQEVEYRSWLQQLSKAKGYDAAKDLRDYDMRGAFKSGVTADERGHLTDEYKKPNHPTFSSGSIYSGEGDKAGGEWIDKGGDKWEFRATPANLKARSRGDLEEYFRRVEPGSSVVFPPEQKAKVGGSAMPVRMGPGGMIPEVPGAVRYGGRTEGGPGGMIPPPPADESPPGGGLLTRFGTGLAGMDDVSKMGLLAMAGSLMTGRRRGLRLGESLGEGMMKFSETKIKGGANGALDQKQKELEIAKAERKEKSIQTALAGMSPEERALAEPDPEGYITQKNQSLFAKQPDQYRPSTPEERALGYAAVNMTTNEPKMLPGDMNTSAVEQARLGMDATRLQMQAASEAARQGDADAARRLQELQIQMQAQAREQTAAIQEQNLQLARDNAARAERQQGIETRIKIDPSLQESEEEQGKIGKGLDAIKRAQELSGEVPSGPTAPLQQWYNMLSDPKMYAKGQEFENRVSSQAYESVKGLFGPNPSNTDREVLDKLKAGLSMPLETRKALLEDTYAYLEQRQKQQQGREGELRALLPQPQGATGPAPVGAPPPPPPGFVPQ